MAATAKQPVTIQRLKIQCAIRCVFIHTLYLVVGTELRDFIRQLGIKVLNVAGPRASKDFDQLRLNRVLVFHMVGNPASGRVLEKIGMKREGLLRQCVRKWNRFEDVVLMAVLHEDWTAQTRPSQSVEKL